MTGSATIRLRGAFLVETVAGIDVTPKSRRARAILAMVALAPSRVRSRKWLQDKLWSERGPDQGSASLRNELSTLRKHFLETGITVLEIDRDTVRLVSDVAVDDRGSAHVLDNLQLLEGLDIADPEFEDWLRLERLVDAANGPSGDLDRLNAQGSVTPLRTRGRPCIAFEEFDVIGSSERAKLFADGLFAELMTVFGALTGAISLRKRDADPISDIHYVLRGSVRNDGRLRIAAQLYCMPAEECIWSGRFEYDDQASFDAQEEIARRVAEAAQISLRDGQWARIWSDTKTSIEAWEQFQRGRVLESKVRKGALREARRHYRNALLIDQDFLPARVSLAFCLLDEIRLGWSANRDASLAEARGLYETVIECQPFGVYTRSLGAFILSAEGRHNEANQMMEAVLQDAPESPELVAYAAVLRRTGGDLDGAIDLYNHALSLTPYPPTWIHTNIALAYLLRDDRRADEHVEKALFDDPDSVRAHLCKVLVHVRDDELEEAKVWASQLRRLQPDFSSDQWRAPECFAGGTDYERIVSALKRVGL